MFKKRAQVSFFLVFALLILLIFLFQNYSLGRQSEKSAETKAVSLPYDIVAFKRSATACLESTAHENIKKLGLHGGLYHVPRQRILMNTTDVPVYLNGSRFYFPPLNVFEQELSAAIHAALPGCIRQQNPLFVVNTAGKITSTIGADAVTVFFEGAVLASVAGENSQLSVDRLIVQFPSSYRKLISFAEHSIIEHRARQTPAAFIPLSRITDFAVLNHLRFTLIPLDSTHVVFTVQENENKYDETFQFGVIYDW